MSIEDIVSTRQINEILHFTTNRGLVGILAAKALKARSLLTEDKYLEHIYLNNCPDRSKDVAWHGYVNLSLTTVNWRLFGISMHKWHRQPEVYWCVMSFDPIILTHEGTYFTTTNNMYSGVLRAKGSHGLERLFAKTIVRWPGSTVTRDADEKTNQPTCHQAEVLYPNEIPIEYLRTIYVEDGAHLDSVGSELDTLASAYNIRCIVRPEIFEEQ